MLTTPRLKEIVDREYDIFACQTDGSILWHDSASGLRNTRLKLARLVRDTGKEFFAMHLPTRDIVFAVDVAKVSVERADKRIFQIAYDDQLRLIRAELLRQRGYPVTSVVGNTAAKLLLTTLHPDKVGIALFIVGHAAPEQTRKDMVDWIRTNFPNSKILALNPPNQEVVDADYNVLQNGPEVWLPIVTASMSPFHAR
jgi:hypothetical protein